MSNKLHLEEGNFYLLRDSIGYAYINEIVPASAMFSAYANGTIVFNTGFEVDQTFGYALRSSRWKLNGTNAMCSGYGPKLDLTAHLGNIERIASDVAEGKIGVPPQKRPVTEAPVVGKLTLDHYYRLRNDKGIVYIYGVFYAFGTQPTRYRGEIILHPEHKDTAFGDMTELRWDANGSHICEYSVSVTSQWDLIEDLGTLGNCQKDPKPKPKPKLAEKPMEQPTSKFPTQTEFQTQVVALRSHVRTVLKTLLDDFSERNWSVAAENAKVDPTAISPNDTKAKEQMLDSITNLMAPFCLHLKPPAALNSGAAKRELQVQAKGKYPFNVIVDPLKATCHIRISREFRTCDYSLLDDTNVQEMFATLNALTYE